MSGLLVSVRNAAEAEEALAGGADIIDVKEPSRGPLGRADAQNARDVIQTVSGRRLVSVALGELAESSDESRLDWLREVGEGVAFAKIGLASISFESNWPELLSSFFWPAFRGASDAQPVAVAYADWQLANSPSPYDVMELAIEYHFAAFLVDTWRKDGQTLLDWLRVEELKEMCAQCRDARLSIALAGSLGQTEIHNLLPLKPDLFAVRGAACAKGDRNAGIDRNRVAALVDLIQESYTKLPASSCNEAGSFAC